MSEADIRHQIEKFYKDRAEFMMHLGIFALVNLCLWGLWGFMAFRAGFILPWPLIVTLGWGAGLAAHAIEWQAKSPKRLTRIKQTAHKRMRQLYGPDWEMMTDEADYERIYNATQKDFNHKKELGIHAAVYVCINVLLLLIWLVVTRATFFPFPFIVAGLWGIGLGAHALNNWFDSSRSLMAREQAVQNAISRYNENEVSDKPKRKRLQHMLTDDGELLEVIEDTEREGQHGY